MITKRYFGRCPSGEGDVYLYTMQNASGMTVSVITLGGALQQILVPDRNGVYADVLGGFDGVDGYFYDHSYNGAIVGRVGNRIKGASFELDGVSYQLTPNVGKDLLHGGKSGFTRRLFDATAIDGDEPCVVFHRVSPDGEEGFPGNLDLTVTYTLTADNAVKIHYVATTDKKTLCNLTNHSYFNLSGYASGDIFDHELWIDSDTYLPLSEKLVPTGEIVDVKGTPFDFNTPKTIGRDFNDDNKHLRIMGGYDTTFNFTGGATKEPVLRAVAYDPASGREMKVYTDQPCAQLYTSNGMNNGYAFKGGMHQRSYNSFAFETQGMPDAIHNPNFAPVTLDVGEVYDTTTVYAFSVRK